jgi:hypothetical protein
VCCKAAIVAIIYVSLSHVKAEFDKVFKTWVTLHPSGRADVSLVDGIAIRHLLGPLEKQTSSES